ncbi:DUF6455 family protein [Pseudoroseicyclus sp. CXY001]|uniref:DUF6455 family protein n=1 Tax=Pseudoroseicyclus sp. CXY001 TaxID=3242492 RepID=UPI00358DD67C
MSILSVLIGERPAARRAREIASLPEGDLAAWNTSRAELTALAAMPAEQIARMETMAHVFGAELQRPEDEAEIARACSGCTEHRACRRELAHETSPEACGFCPNAETFSRIAAG